MLAAVRSVPGVCRKPAVCTGSRRGANIMSWNDFYQRRDILEAALRQAGHHPSDPLSLEEIPGATKYFATEDELLVALQYKWNQVFGGHLRAEMADPDYADQDLALDRV